MKKAVITPFCLVLLMGLTSCYPLGFFAAGGAAGVGGYKYYQGGLTVVYQAPYIKVWDATLTTLKKMKLEIESAKHDLTSGQISAKMTDGTYVTVGVKYESPETTHVTIRVGLGDKDSSLIIKERIQKTLNL